MWMKNEHNLIYEYHLTNIRYLYTMDCSPIYIYRTIFVLCKKKSKTNIEKEMDFQIHLFKVKRKRTFKGSSVRSSSFFCKLCQKYTFNLIFLTI
jgi:hypothetical protein